MKEQETLELYDFNDDKDINLFKGKSGIYALVHISYNKEEIVYVGQSKDIARRLKQHRNAKTQLEKIITEYIKENGKCNRAKQMALYRFIDCNKDDIQFAILKETEELNKWEEHYITTYKPRYNYKGVDVPY